MGRSEYDAQWTPEGGCLRGHHHHNIGNAAAGSKHLRMTGEGVTGGVQGCLVDGRCYEGVDRAIERQSDCPVDGKAGQQPGLGDGAGIMVPRLRVRPCTDVNEFSTRLVRNRAARTDEYQMMRQGRAILLRGRCCDFRSDSAWVAQGDGDP
jgi:hypothetical protein